MNACMKVVRDDGRLVKDAEYEVADMPRLYIINSDEQIRMT